MGQHGVVNSDVRFRQESPGSPAGRLLRAEFWSHVCELAGMDDRDGPPVSDEVDLVAPGGTFVVAESEGVDVGCVGARFLGADRAEVKRLYVAPRGQRRGLGRSLLRNVEEWARDHGARELVLDTRADLHAARQLYRVEGFVEVEPYNDNEHAQVWYAKPLS